MSRTLDVDREELLDSLVNVVPLAIIVALTVLFVAVNPWGWADADVIALVVGLHVIPIVTLLPVTYLAVKVVGEAARDGHSPTAARIRDWFAGNDGSASDASASEPDAHDAEE